MIIMNLKICIINLSKLIMEVTPICYNSLQIILELKEIMNSLEDQSFCKITLMKICIKTKKQKLPKKKI